MSINNKFSIAPMMDWIACIRFSHVINGLPTIENAMEAYWSTARKTVPTNTNPLILQTIIFWILTLYRRPKLGSLAHWSIAYNPEKAPDGLRQNFLSSIIIATLIAGPESGSEPAWGIRECGPYTRRSSEKGGLCSFYTLPIVLCTISLQHDSFARQYVDLLALTVKHHEYL